ncbi:hypothetical protein J4714_13430 [Staphylococcus epidermidis]|nr:hypothetical protein [Staphylococcus epidermidis]
MHEPGGEQGESIVDGPATLKTSCVCGYRRAVALHRGRGAGRTLAGCEDQRQAHQ